MLRSAVLCLVARASLGALASAQTNPEGVVGQEACRSCHEDVHAKWDASRHSKMVQPATVESVQGDFDAESIRLRGKDYGLRKEGGKFYISESFFTPERREHEIQYTLGNRRIQHYLTTLEDGRIIVLPPSWDVLRQEWFHNLEIAAPDQQQGEIPVQVWNKNCFGCHVSEEVKNYAPSDRHYETEWLDFGTSCERCHGPGREHGAYHQREEPVPPELDVVVPAKLDHDRASAVCAQCHSFRDVLAFGFTAGEDYYDYFMPLLEYSQEPSKDPTWYTDGKTRRFSTNALGIWQSQCYLNSELSCTTCHPDGHTPEIEDNLALRAERRTVCTRCHEAIGKDVEAHSFHRASSEGSSCVNCHMPRSVYSIKAEMRDHSISIPAPENTARYGIPNACNLCHEDKAPEWAVEALDRWYPESTKRDRILKRAETFNLARERAPNAVAHLLALYRDETQGPLPRANALGYLGDFDDPRVLPTLSAALTDDHPLIRGIAAVELGKLPASYREPATRLLAKAMVDDKRIVRMNATIGLLNMGVVKLAGEAGKAFEKAKQDHIDRGAFHFDDAGQLMNLGRFHVLNGDVEPAEEAFETSYRINPDQPGIRFFVALARLRRGQSSEARKLLERVEDDDPFAGTARELLQKIER